MVKPSVTNVRRKQQMKLHKKEVKQINSEMGRADVGCVVTSHLDAKWPMCREDPRPGRSCSDTKAPETRTLRAEREWLYGALLLNGCWAPGVFWWPVSSLLVRLWFCFMVTLCVVCLACTPLRLSELSIMLLRVVSSFFHLGVLC